MKLLLVNQTFYPDLMATGQYLTEVALRLVERGHSVTVLASRRGYDNPAQTFRARELWHGIRIIRVAGYFGFGKTTRWRRALDFGSFLLYCVARLVFLPKPDVVVALTSPPLISFVASCFAWVRRCRFVYWVMDLNPDEAVAAGWLCPGSVVARVLEGMSRFSFQRATRIIALDRFMRDRIVAKGVGMGKTKVVPLWSQDGQIFFDPIGRRRFRAAYGLEGKFVVMYSGNHSPCHPLETLLRAADRLAGKEQIVFCFIGGGSEWRKMASASSPNLRFLPYQPLEDLAGSLSAADLHVVVMGPPFVGLVHPCKIYNILRVGTRVLYIGPKASHVTEMFNRSVGQEEEGREAGACAGKEHGGPTWERHPGLKSEWRTGSPRTLCSMDRSLRVDRGSVLLQARHGEVTKVVQLILRARVEHLEVGGGASEAIRKHFSRERVLPQLIHEIEMACDKNRT